MDILNSSLYHDINHSLLFNNEFLYDNTFLLKYFPKFLNIKIRDSFNGLFLILAYTPLQKHLNYYQIGYSFTNQEQNIIYENKYPILVNYLKLNLIYYGLYLEENHFWSNIFNKYTYLKILAKYPFKNPADYQEFYEILAASNANNIMIYEILSLYLFYNFKFKNLLKIINDYLYYFNYNINHVQSYTNALIQTLTHYDKNLILNEYQFLIDTFLNMLDVDADEHHKMKLLEKIIETVYNTNEFNEPIAELISYNYANYIILEVIERYKIDVKKCLFDWMQYYYSLIDYKFVLEIGFGLNESLIENLWVNDDDDDDDDDGNNDIFHNPNDANEANENREFYKRLNRENNKVILNYFWNKFSKENNYFINKFYGHYTLLMIVINFAEIELAKKMLEHPDLNLNIMNNKGQSGLSYSLNRNNQREGLSIFKLLMSPEYLNRLNLLDLINSQIIDIITNMRDIDMKINVIENLLNSLYEQINLETNLNKINEKIRYLKFVVDDEFERIFRDIFEEMIY